MKKQVLFFLLAFLVISNVLAQKRMYKTGMLLDEKPVKDIELYDFDALGFGETLPDSVSLVEYAPYPGNQGNYATCVGWSYAYCGTSILYAQKFGIKNRQVITALAMCPFSVYNRIKESYDISCVYGTHMHLAAREMEKGGTKRYHINEIGCGDLASKDSVYRIFKVDNTYAIWDFYQDIAEKDSLKILNTKKALAAKKPVMIGYKTTYSFCYDIRKSDGFWVKNSLNLYPSGGHAMTVVAYNDKKFGGAFLLQNSWGKEWGKDGYAWITYKDYAEYTYNAYVIELEDGKKTSASLKNGCEYGDCKNGYSRFRFESGDVYEGEVKNGSPEGNGIYQYANGDVFTGAFKSGKKEGKGTYYFADGTVKVAYWAADTINANGDYLEYGYGSVDGGAGGTFTGYYKGENWIWGEYDAGSYSNSVYLGKFMDNKKNGFGMRVYENYLYVGDVKDDAFNKTYAFISTASKRIYIYQNDGAFKKLDNTVSLSDKVVLFEENPADSIATLDRKLCTYGDCENGYGKYTYPSGNTYEGFFTNGYRNGYGIYTLKPSGNSYEGTYFVNDKHEVGKVVMADGSYFIGNFDSGKKNGYGLYMSKEGKALSGEWLDDKYTEWEEDLGFGGGEDPKAKEVAEKTVQPKKHKAQKQAKTTLK